MGDFECQIGHISTKCSDPCKFEHVLGDEVGSMDGLTLILGNVLRVLVGSNDTEGL